MPLDEKKLLVKEGVSITPFFTVDNKSVILVSSVNSNVRIQRRASFDEDLWVNIIKDGVTLDLRNDNNYVTINQQGVYRLNTDDISNLDSSSYVMFEDAEIFSLETSTNLNVNPSSVVTIEPEIYFGLANPNNPLISASRGSFYYVTIDGTSNSESTEQWVFTGTEWVNIAQSISGRLLDLTQWSNSIPTTSIPNGSENNILDFITDANKTAISASTSGALNIVEDPSGNYITGNWQGVVEKLAMRLSIGVQHGGTDFFRFLLRRKADDSIVLVAPFSSNNADVPEASITFSTISYIGSPTDPFVQDGFYVSVANNSGGGLSISSFVNILISREYETPL